VDRQGRTLLKNAMENPSLPARAYDRIIIVSTIIADLEASDNIINEHLVEAIQHPSLDRESWGFYINFVNLIGPAARRNLRIAITIEIEKLGGDPSSSSSFS
jgi:hypothetical protein